jgi:hypothetical protein
MQVLIEAATVGAMLAPLMLLGLRLVNTASASQILLLGFLLGFFFHLFCEVIGLNRWYCRFGAACS